MPNFIVLKINFMNRRSFVKTSAMATTLPGFNILHDHSKSEADPSVLGHGTHKYRAIKGWGVLDAGKNPVNDCHEMVSLSGMSRINFR